MTLSRRLLALDQDTRLPYIVRAFAIETVGRIGDTSSIPPLAHLETDASLSALATMGEPAFDALWEQRSRWLSPGSANKAVLANLSDIACLERLEPYIATDTSYLVITFCRELAENLGEAAYPVLMRWLDSPQARVRVCAARALQCLSLEPQAILRLTELLHDSNRGVRHYSAHTLAHHKMLDCYPILIEQLTDSDLDFGTVAALGKLGDSRAVPALLHTLEKFSPNRHRDIDAELMVQEFIRALGRLGSSEAIPALKRLLAEELQRSFHDTGDADTAIETANALAMLGDTEVLPTLIQQLRYVDTSYGTMPFEGLALFGDAACEALIQALKERSPILRGNALHALGQLGNLQALPALQVFFGKTKNTWHRWECARARVRLEDSTVLPQVLPWISSLEWMEELVAHEAIRHFGEEADAELLADLLEAQPAEQNPNTMAMETLGLMGAKAHPGVHRLLQSSQERPRMLACLIAARSNEPTYKSQLQELVEDSSAPDSLRSLAEASLVWLPEAT